ncbi:thioredoxin family protein [Anaeromyxobacter oryzisoli]|uniref:thioredoxin family protein n=1 Tax=Anaeromyxobacter oryzisoli TaxID=2925408 RepID=UPI001F57BE31|nr:thioredoxin domain-containing protein [Anaeromyxobacter sp. SG63]
MAVYRCAGCGAVNRSQPDSGPPQACYRCRRPLDTSGRPQAVDAAALVTTIRCSPAPVLVDFAARDLAAPALDGLAAARAGELVVLRVDPGEEPAAAQAYAIRFTPTLVLFQGGSEVARRCDAPGPIDMHAWVEQASSARAP